MANSSCGTCTFVTATILGPIVLVLMAVSFATDHWLEFDVKRSVLTAQQRQESTSDFIMGRYTHTRQRGLFRECYPTNETACEYKNHLFMNHFLAKWGG